MRVLYEGIGIVQKENSLSKLDYQEASIEFWKWKKVVLENIRKWVS